jgi:F0F1-type ATP synthase assembly protein I
MVAKEDNLSNIERKEVVKEINKRIHTKVVSEAKEFKNEFKKQTSTAIMAAFGLIIALAWKDVITDLIGKIGFVKSYGLIISAVLLTLVSVLGIYLISKWAKSGENK